MGSKSPGRTRTGIFSTLGRSRSFGWALLNSSVLCLGLVACSDSLLENGVDATDGAVCRVQMIDGFNQFEATLEAVQYSPDSWLVSSRVAPGQPWEVEVVVSEGGWLDCDAGVPSIDRKELLEKYPMVDSPQLTFKRWPDQRCSDFEESLILFLVMEWFFYG